MQWSWNFELRNDISDHLGCWSCEKSHSSTFIIYMCVCGEGGGGRQSLATKLVVT